MNKLTLLPVFGTLVSAGWLGLAAQAGPHAEVPPRYLASGTLERFDPRFNRLIAPGTKIEQLVEGIEWAEGPVWVRRAHYLLFSDVKANTIYKWKDGDGLRVFLQPSGYTGAVPRSGEPGSNGLTLDAAGRLVMCEHGDRCIGRLEQDGQRTILAQFYQWRRFNSPNDLVYKSNGDLYFTDPPYGLLGADHQVGKELVFSGVFRLQPNGKVTLLTDDLTFPNGLAFSPDEKKLYVAVSDLRDPVWMVYNVKTDGTLGRGRVFFDATSLVKPGMGLPDGMKVDRQGNLFAAALNGIQVFSPDGKRLGAIDTGVRTANCAWGDDGSTLYITANHYLCRIRTKTKGEGF